MKQQRQAAREARNAYQCWLSVQLYTAIQKEQEGQHPLTGQRAANVRRHLEAT